MIRLERKVSDAVKKRVVRSSRRRRRKDKDKGSIADNAGTDNECSSGYLDRSEHSTTSYMSHYTTGTFSYAEGSCRPRDDFTFTDDCEDSSACSSSVGSSVEEMMLKIQEVTLAPEEPLPDDQRYRTINQNEFFVECMFQGAGTTSIVHFYDDQNPTSQSIDSALESLSRSYYHKKKCKFLRLDGAWTQFVSAKLSIDKFPTVVVIHDNNVVIDRLSNFEEEADSFMEELLEGWLDESLRKANNK